MAYHAFLFPRYSGLDAEYSRPDEEALCSASFPAERNAVGQHLTPKSRRQFSPTKSCLSPQPTSKSADVKTVCGVA